jgi:hypothetical protein
MEYDPENGKESPHSAHANGMNELSTVTSFYRQVAGRKFHTEIFVSPLSERCWHGLGMSHDHPNL